MQVTHRGHHIELLADHALYLPEEAALVLSDVHLGKAAAFRAHGLAVPDGDNAKDLHRISQLLELTQAKQLIIAGDLLHAPESRFPELENWFLSCSANITLVIGNHDKRSLPENFIISSVPTLQLGSFHIVHDPADAPPEQFSICGHIHPAVRIKDELRKAIHSPCFHLSEHILTLPSFGSFTGGEVITPKQQDRIFIPLNGRIVEIPSSSCAKRKK